MSRKRKQTQDAEMMPKDSIDQIYGDLDVCLADHIGVGSDQITKSELRRLKAEIKRGNVDGSDILQSILKKSQKVFNTINNILIKYNISNNLGSDEQNILDHMDKKPKVISTRSVELPDKMPPIIDRIFNHYVEADSDSDSESDSDEDWKDDRMEKNNNTRVTKRKNFTDKERKTIEQNMPKIESKYADGRIWFEDVILAKFNENDTLWMYRQFSRVDELPPCAERFELEDKIEKRYHFLKQLQDNGMYSSSIGCDEHDISKSVLCSKQPDAIKKMLLQKISTVTKDSIEEYQKTVGWVDTVLSIPTETKSIKNNVGQTLKNLHNNLKKNMSCVDQTAREIAQAVCSMITDPDNNGYILALVGPPGVGKTTISTLISESTGMGFGQISCGSVHDSSVITGHSSTYIGAKTGQLTQILINNKQLDNVILLDEMDKMPNEKLIPILLQILDKSQNNRFKDDFCPEINIDLSKNFFIIAVNTLDTIGDVLKDRLKVINVSGYDVDQKVEICTKHIIPKIIRRTGCDNVIATSTIRKCIEMISPNISGVRDLERFFADIYEKILLSRYIDSDPIPRKIDLNMVNRLIGRR
jgi:hypothetical protein